MKAKVTHRHAAGAYHSHDSACLGKQMRLALHSSQLPKNSPLRVLAAMLDLPAGTRFLRAFRNVSLDDLSLLEDWLSIPFPLKGKPGYAITIPNFLRWHSVSRSVLKAFLLASEEDLASEMRCFLSIPSSGLNWSKITSALESSLYGEGHSPVLVRYMNGLDAFAMIEQPSDVMVVPAEMPEDEADSGSAGHGGEFYSQFRLALRRMSDCVLGRASGERVWTFAIEQLDPTDTSDDAQLVRAGYWFNQIVLSDAKAPGVERWSSWFADAQAGALKDIRPRELSSRLEYMRQMIPALKILRSGGGQSTQGSLICAARVLRASALFVDILQTASVVRAPKMPSAEAVPWPNSEPLGQWKDDCSELESDARRVLEIILVHGFQRFRALRSVSPKDILCSGKIVEIRIPDDKGGMRKQIIPIYRLAPPEAVDFLRTFKVPDNAATIPLTELAGFGRVEAKGKNSRRVYKVMLQWAGKLHLPRKSGLSFAPLRAQIFRNPDLRNHPYFPEQLREHWWFSDEGLAQFGRLIPAANTDVAEVIRRIAGWKTYSQLFSSYCRTWHIQMGLLLTEGRNLK